ncbi:hypothetical protein HYH03_018868 [Edaphochlamys debaryana]|uniref:BTB domain-containing protein n=1 Tax=Edaphochlamys debaryana TaxID=47281 RepID=A0A836BMW6_9CHLO|nr:hypothetical protein HYH03_018868 [Edaphochlamys debaryana]|eukprot:KAG2482187.1 hypothetical protein HYH03_018868 [Edaphochlamys debaryana]
MAAPAPSAALAAATTKRRVCGWVPSSDQGLAIEDLFARDAPLARKADVCVVTIDGKELWLHRAMLEMWSDFLADLCEAAEDQTDDSTFVTVHVSDTASDLALLLGCLYPVGGSGLQPDSALRLLRLADKYHCPHVIARAADFVVHHVMPRLGSSTASASASVQDPVDAAEFLRLQPPPATTAEAEAAVAEWAVECAELGSRLGLEELAEAAAELLCRGLFAWRLQSWSSPPLSAPMLLTLWMQADCHRDRLLRLAQALSPEAWVDCLLTAIPQPDLEEAAAAAGGEAAKKVRRQAAGVAARRRGGAAGGGADGAAGGGGGPRLVPVVVAAAGPAGPAAAAAQPQPQPFQAAAAAGPAPAHQPFAQAPPPGPAPHHGPPHQAQPFLQAPAPAPAAAAAHPHPHPQPVQQLPLFHQALLQHHAGGGGGGIGAPWGPEPFMAPGQGHW